VLKYLLTLSSFIIQSTRQTIVGLGESDHQNPKTPKPQNPTIMNLN
jgi:hypothetical protein